MLITCYCGDPMTVKHTQDHSHEPLIISDSKNANVLPDLKYSKFHNVQHPDISYQN